LSFVEFTKQLFKVVVLYTVLVLLVLVARR